MEDESQLWEDGSDEATVPTPLPGAPRDCQFTRARGIGQQGPALLLPPASVAPPQCSDNQLTLGARWRLRTTTLHGSHCVSRTCRGSKSDDLGDMRRPRKMRCR